MTDLSDLHSLGEVEDFMRSVEHGIKKGMAHLAVSLGIIKTESLYLEICPSFRQYILLERTNLKYKEAVRLARIGENYLLYREQLEAHGIKLIEHMSKVFYLDREIVEHDPMVFDRLKAHTVRGFAEYVAQKKRDWIDVYPNKDIDGDVTVKGTGLYIGGEKLKGFNINEARQKMGENKRAVVLWVDDDEVETRRVKRAISRAGIAG